MLLRVWVDLHIFLPFLHRKITLMTPLCFSLLNPLHAGRLFYCYMLDKSICHFRVVRSVLSLYFIFDGKSC